MTAMRPSCSTRAVCCLPLQIEEVSPHALKRKGRPAPNAWVTACRKTEAQVARLYSPMRNTSRRAAYSTLDGARCRRLSPPRDSIEGSENDVRNVSGDDVLALTSDSSFDDSEWRLKIVCHENSRAILQTLPLGIRSDSIGDATGAVARGLSVDRAKSKGSGVVVRPSEGRSQSPDPLICPRTGHPSYERQCDLVPSIQRHQPERRSPSG